MKLDFGVGLVTQHRRKKFIELVNDIEGWGYNNLWILDEELYRDCYVHMALSALNTTRVRLGTAVTNPVTRHPAITAEAVGTIDELSNGRAVLGIGLGGSIRKMLKLESSIPRLREATLIIRRLWAGEKINFEVSRFVCLFSWLFPCLSFQILQR